MKAPLPELSIRDVHLIQVSHDSPGQPNYRSGTCLGGLRTRYSHGYRVDVNADRMSTRQARGIQGRPASAERVEHPSGVRIEIEVTQGEVQREHRVVRADRIEPEPIPRPFADFSHPGHDRIVLAMFRPDGKEDDPGQSGSRIFALWLPGSVGECR